MRAKARRLKADQGLDLIVVDYLQLMRGRGDEGSREQEISNISRSLKALAKELQGAGCGALAAEPGSRDAAGQGKKPDAGRPARIRAPSSRTPM